MRALLIIVFLLCLAPVALAQFNPPDRIRGGGGIVQVDSTGAVKIQPLVSQGIRVKGGSVTPPLSAAGEATFYFDTGTGVMRISQNGGAYVNFSSPNGGGTGTVTSVGLSMPALFSVAGSPVTGAGTLAVSLVSQAANTVLAAPDGSAGVPAARLLVANDIPALDASKITTGILPTARGGLGFTNSYVFGDIVYADSATTLNRIHGNQTTASMFLRSIGSGTQVTSEGFAAITGADLPAINLANSGAGGVTGTLPTGNGGTGITSIGGAGTLLGVNSGGTALQNGTLAAGSNLTLTQSGSTITFDASGTLGVSWSNITAPTANLALAMGNNRSAFTYGSATGASTDIHTIRDTASNTGTGALVAIYTQASSAAVPIRITAGGTANGVQMSPSGLLSPIGTGGITPSQIALGSSGAGGVGGTLTVPNGGTGVASLTAYGVLAGGTTSTGALQQVSGLGTSGQVLTSNGAGALPTWQTAVTSITGTAHQIIASASTGAVTLSAPQNIDTTSDVTFNRLALAGGSPNSVVALYVPVTGTTINYGVDVDITTTSGTNYAVSGTARSSGSNINYGGFFEARSSTTQNIAVYAHMASGGAGSTNYALFTDSPATAGGITYWALYNSGAAASFTAGRFAIANSAVLSLGTLSVQSDTTTIPALAVQGAASQTAHLTDWLNSSNTVLSSILKDGSWQPPHIADASALNDSLYYSTTASKLVYKDSGGTVNALY